jgi:hypothetical protein
MTKEESQNGLVIRNCLEAVDAAQPWFICILGQRYGWSFTTDPDSELLKQTFDIAAENYPWVDKYRDRSVTEIEVLHGYLNKSPEKRKGTKFLLYIRQPMLGEDAPENECENEEARAKLEDLKRRCLEVAKPRYFTAVEQLGKFVLMDLQEQIEKEFPMARGYSAAEAEEAAHVSYSRVKATPHAQIPANLDLLRHHVPTWDGSERLGDRVEDKQTTQVTKPLLLYGEPGCGKSALLSHYFHRVVPQEERHGDIVMVLHHCGASAASCKLENVLLRFMEQCRARLPRSGIKFFGAKEILPTDRMGLIAALPDFIEHAATAAQAANKQLIWVIDGLEHIERSAQRLGDHGRMSWLSASDTEWFPKLPLPPNFHFICTVSAAADPHTLNSTVRRGSEIQRAVGRRSEEKGRRTTSATTAHASYTRQLLDHLSKQEWKIRQVQLLSEHESEEVVHAFLRVHHHKLTPAQLHKLTSTETCRLPSFLATVCKLLLQFGNFQGLDQQLDQCLQATSVAGLIRFAVSRFSAPDAKLAIRTLSYIMCSRAGLSQDELFELQSLDSTLRGLEPMTPFQFAGIFRTMQPWLKADSDGFFSLANESSRIAVMDMFHEMGSDQKDARMRGRNSSSIGSNAGCRDMAGADCVGQESSLDDEEQKVLAPLHTTAALFFDEKVAKTSYRRVEFVYHSFRAASAFTPAADSASNKSAAKRRRNSRLVKEMLNEVEEGDEPTAVGTAGVSADGERGEFEKLVDVEKLADLSLLPHLLGPHFVNTFKQLCQEPSAAAEKASSRKPSHTPSNRSNEFFAAFVECCDEKLRVYNSSSNNNAPDEEWRLRLRVADFAQEVGEYALSGGLLERCVAWTTHRRKRPLTETTTHDNSAQSSKFADENHVLCCTKLAQLYSRFNVKPIFSDTPIGGNFGGMAAAARPPQNTVRHSKLSHQKSNGGVISVTEQAVIATGSIPSPPVPRRVAILHSPHSNSTESTPDSPVTVVVAKNPAHQGQELHLYGGMDGMVAAERLLSHAVDDLSEADDALTMQWEKTSADNASRLRSRTMLPEIYQSLGWIKIAGRATLTAAVDLADEQLRMEIGQAEDETAAGPSNDVQLARETVVTAAAAVADVDRQALVYFRCALLSRKDMDDWVGVAHALNGLGTLRQKQLRFDNAERLFKRCLELRRQHLYGTHPDIAQVLTSLGSLYYDIGAGRLEEAEKAFMEAIQVYSLSIGADHPRLKHARTGLVKVSQLMAKQDSPSHRGRQI